MNSEGEFEDHGNMGYDGAQDDEFDSSPRPAKRRRTTETATTRAKKQSTTRKTLATTKTRAKKKDVKEDSIVDGDEEDSFDPPVPVVKAKRKPRKKAQVNDDESINGESDATLGRATAKSKRKPRKRTSIGSDDDGVDLEDTEQSKKPKHRIHTPTFQEFLPETFLDEEPPASSAPWSLRGPIWRKDLAPKPPQPVSKPPPLLHSVLTKPSPRLETPNHIVPHPPVLSVRGNMPRSTVRNVSPPVPPSVNSAIKRQELWEAGDMSDDIDPEDLMLLETHIPPPKKSAPMALSASVPRSPGKPPQSAPAPQTAVEEYGSDLEDLTLLETAMSQAMNPAVSAASGLTSRSPRKFPEKIHREHTEIPTDDIDLDDLELLERDMPKANELTSGVFRASNPRLSNKLPQKTPGPQNVNEVDVFANELADLGSDAFDDSDDPSPAKAAISISSSPPKSATRPNLAPPRGGLRQTTLFGGTVVPMGPASQANKRHAWPLATQKEPPTHHKLNEGAIKTWVYPTNLGTIRDYQYNIVARGLFHNLLVALPTGLGKTFIAATIMLNWFRWTESAQIVFVAPTKPLVAQQVEACFHIVGIPRSQTIMLTGETPPGLRAEEWKTKRVFFMTPQTIINDLKTGLCDPKRVVLVVVDEAHRATGGYAYVEVIKFLRRFNSSFRVLALTATPGSTVETVQQVIDGLDISRVEIRTESSLDIRQYVHSRDIDSIKFDYSEDQQMIMELASNAIRPVLNKLASQNAYWNRDPMKLSAFACTQAQRQWFASDAGKNAPQAVKGMVSSIFRVLASIGHSISMLKFHGIGPFYNGMVNFRNNVDGGQLKGKYGTQIRDDENFVKMMNMMQTWTRNPDFLGHPKLEYLRGVVLNHFLDAGEGRAVHGAEPFKTRIMIFAQWRDSAEEIVRVLKRNEPMIRPHVFVGQADSKNSEGMGQKRQLEVIKEFKEGKYNTLVATSIGEEGLDIGEVDLIVCYDASSSPIRMLQRMGRTGRKRKGNIVLLLMRDKEANDFEKAKDNYEKMQGMIAAGDQFTFHDDRSPRIIPREIQPTVDKRVVEIPIENSQATLPEPSRRKRVPKMPPKKFHMPDNVRTGFTTASRMDEDDDGVEVKPVRGKAKAKKPAASRKKKDPTPEPETAPLPFLEDVYLNKVQERELERKYQYVQDTDDGVPTVTAPRLDRFSTAFPGRSAYIPHSRAALQIASTMRKIREIDDDAIQRFKDNFHESDLEGDVSELQGDTTVTEVQHTEPAAKTTKARKTNATKPRAPKAQAAAKASKVTKTAKAAQIPKPRGRPRKGPIRKDSSDMEGSSSSPEPTPANLRIGTQGIDLGSADTSGEEELHGEEADSDLDDFVVGSDAPIEFVSSSLPQTQKTSRRNRLDLFTQDGAEVASDDELLSAGGAGNEGSGAGDGSDTEVEAPARRQVRRRQVVDEDSDE